MVPVEVGGDVIFDMVLSTYAPISYVTEQMRDVLVGLDFAHQLDGNHCLLRNVQIEGQPIDDLPVRVRRSPLLTDVDGILGLDFLSRFAEITFNVATMRLRLSYA
jgi:hypothetical protein